MERYQTLTPLALAFLGDAIHTAYVREYVLTLSQKTMANYHNLAKTYCNAGRQKDSLQKLILTDEEQDIVRRARNSKSKHTAKNYNEEDYKKATAFEALIGYLYLTKQQNRLEEVLKISVSE